jgi:magnesium transporter
MIEEMDLKPGKLGLIINRAPGGVLDEGVRAEIAKHGLELIGVLPQDDAVYRCDCNGEPSAKLPESTPVKAALRDIMSTMNSSDIAWILDELDERKLPVVFRLLPKELAAEAFAEMEPEQQELLIRGFSDSELKEVLDEMFLDDAVDMIEEMPANVVRRILAQADPDMRKQINELLRYPEHSAGSIMTTEYVSLRPGMTVGEAILRIRRTGVDKETIYTCYVTKDRHLIGMVTVKDLLLCTDDEMRISDMMEENIISVGTHDDQEQVAQMFSKYNFLALPVVDAEQRMVGIITFDDAMDVMEDEATEDMEMMAAMRPSDKP